MILSNNQHPPTMYDSMIHEILTKIVQEDIGGADEDKDMHQSDISSSAETVRDSQHNENMDE